MPRKRVTESRDVVCLCDPAMSWIDRGKLVKYSLSRNIEDLGDLKTLQEQPRIYRCRPLSTRAETTGKLYLDENNADAAWMIVASHVENISDIATLKKRQINNIDTLEDEVREILPFDEVHEIAKVICELPNSGDNRPFSPPDTWEQGLMRTQWYRALQEPPAAPTDSADTATVRENKIQE